MSTQDSVDFELADYHRSRKNIDFPFIESLFERDERDLLKRVVDRHPNHIVRMPNADLIAAGYVSGIGGSVPEVWNGEILKL